jgi:N-acetylglucosaminyldiphosphoundecaprenol N-acetyl-beta-D-mannosaminyltransferase
MLPAPNCPLSVSKSPATEIRRTRVLGVPISLVDLPRAAAQISEWAKGKTRAHLVFVREVASLMLTVEQPKLLELHEEASLIVADGMPLVWVCRMYGYGKEIGRVTGADLVESICELSLSTGQSHYFYGGMPSVAEKMAEVLSRRYPGLKIAGVCSPPMRDIDSNFDLSGSRLTEVESIRGSGAAYIWVGISSPKQEYWMAKAAPLVGRGVFIGVGAAFDFHSGAVRRAPPWMRNNGLEWLYRLYREPRRLWRRYLVLAPRFVVKIVLDLSRRSTVQSDLTKS